MTEDPVTTSQLTSVMLALAVWFVDQNVPDHGCFIFGSVMSHSVIQVLQLVGFYSKCNVLSYNNCSPPSNYFDRQLRSD